MPRFEQEYYSDFSIEQLYTVVAEVDKYPEFLPWCRAARIVEEQGNDVVADLVISYKAFTESYRSGIKLRPPEKQGSDAYIDVDLINGPFKHLVNKWKFTHENGQTKVYFFVDFAFKSSLLEKMMEMFFMDVCKKMMTAFENRAKSLYE